MCHQPLEVFVDGNHGLHAAAIGYRQQILHDEITTRVHEQLKWRVWKSSK